MLILDYVEIRKARLKAGCECAADSEQGEHQGQESGLAAPRAAAWGRRPPVPHPFISKGGGLALAPPCPGVGRPYSGLRRVPDSIQLR